MTGVPGSGVQLTADPDGDLERLLRSGRKRRRQVTPRDRDRPAPLSPSQRRLWFLDRMAPGAPTYNAVVAFEAVGPLDVAALTASLTDVVARHDILHSIILGEENPEQVVLDEWDLESAFDDLSDRPEASRRDSGVDVVQKFCRRPYDLTRDLPIRLLVVRLGANHHLVAFAEHHIAFDGWSDEVLFGELSEGYRARTEGRTWNPEPLVLQYADVAAFWASEPEDPAHARYWADVMAGAPVHAHLPVDRQPSDPRRHCGVHLDVAVADVAEPLRQLQVAERATAYMVLSAAFAVAVFRWSGHGDVVLGTPMANRERAEFEPLIGFFSNTVPVRVTLDGGQTFREAVQAFRVADLGAMEHQATPFDRIVEIAQAERNPRRNPLFQVNVRVQHGPPVVPVLPGVEVVPVAIDLGFSRFDLALDVAVLGADVRGYLEFDTDLFDERTVTEFGHWLETLIQSAVNDPDVPLQKLPFGPEPRPVRGGRRHAEMPT